MIHTSIIFFLGLCPVIPLMTHFAEGLLLAAEFWLLFGAGILCGMAAAHFNIKKFSQVIRYLGIMLTAALYVQILGALFPVLTVSCESYLYLFAFSYILIISVVTYSQNNAPLTLPAAYSLLLPAGTAGLVEHPGTFSCAAGLLGKQCRYADAARYWGMAVRQPTERDAAPFPRSRHLSGSVVKRNRYADTVFYLLLYPFRIRSFSIRHRTGTAFDECAFGSCDSAVSVQVRYFDNGSGFDQLAA